MSDNFYDRFTINGEKLDFYRICLLYEITDPCLQHALKKLLRAGRSHKDIHTDVRNAIDTLKRWEELHPREEEKSDAPPPACLLPNGMTVCCNKRAMKIENERWKCSHCRRFLSVVILGASCLKCHGNEFIPRDDLSFSCANCGELSL